MTDDSVLRLRGLEVRYGDQRAVAGIDLDVHPGEVLGLIGPDGAGKTSTLRVLAGILRPADGSCTAFGEDIWATRRILHHRLGYLAQGFALYTDLTVDENVQFFALMYGVQGWRERRDDLLDLVGLSSFRGRLAERLSGGMKQKLALACTLIHSPDILLLDEPTTGVDPVTRRELWKLLGELVARGLTLVVATPYLDEAERCTRVVLMHHGRVLADAAPAKIVDRLPGTIVEVHASPRSQAEAALRDAPGVTDLTVFGASLHVRLEEADDPLSPVRTALEASGVEVRDLRRIPGGLEDAFLYLTQRSTISAEAS